MVSSRDDKLPRSFREAPMFHDQSFVLAVLAILPALMEAAARLVAALRRRRK
jgi:hypothetical protein